MHIPEHIDENIFDRRVIGLHRILSIVIAGDIGQDDRYYLRQSVNLVRDSLVGI